MSKDEPLAFGQVWEWRGSGRSMLIAPDPSNRNDRAYWRVIRLDEKRSFLYSMMTDPKGMPIDGWEKLDD